MSDSIKKFYTELGESYSFIAKSYESENLLRKMYFQERANSILSYLLPRLTNESIVLDAGCGGGWYLKAMAAHCKKVHGIDYSPGFVKQAREFLMGVPNVVINEGDATCLEFENSSFDVALMTEVVEHTTYPEKAINEIKRVLKNDGIAILTAPSILNLQEWGTWLLKKIKGEFNDHLHFYTPRSFVKFVENQGFKVEEISMCLFFPIPFKYLHLKNTNHFIHRMYTITEGVLKKIPLINKLGWVTIVVARKVS